MNDHAREQSLRRQSALAQTHVVVVTYCPDPGVMARQFHRLAEEGVNVVLVDNFSPMQEEIIAAAAGYGFEHIALEKNVGVAGAQNAGLEKVRAMKGEYAVLLDQDSIPDEGAFEALLDALLNASEGAPVAAIGSSYTLQAGTPGSSFVRFAWFGFRKVYCAPGDPGLHQVDFLISSGSLFPMSVLAEVGPMQEELFIDHVDTEWFLRAGSLGYRSYGSCGARMSHALGERVVRIWLGRWRTVPVHKSFRYYFTFRNSIWLYRQKYAPVKWITADAVRLLYIFLFSALFLPSRRDNLKWMFRGMRDGFRDAGDWDSASVVHAASETGRNRG